VATGGDSPHRDGDGSGGRLTDAHASWSGRAHPVDQRGHVEAQHVRDLQHLDEVQAALTGLILGDEGLGSVERRGEGHLGQAPLASRLGEDLAETHVLRTEDRPRHRSCHTTMAMTLEAALYYPNIGYSGNG